MDYLEHIRSNSALFGEVLAGVEPAANVPCCPEWEAADLVWHLTEVQWFWGSIVGERLTDPDRAEETKPDRPADYGEALGLFGTASDRLVEALASTPDDQRLWTWHDPDQTAGFVRRRQAHEALIHRVDAEMVAKIDPSVDAGLAADGVDEVLDVFIGGIPEWATFTPDGASLRIHATDVGRRWGLAFGRMTGTSPNSGNTYDLGAATVGLDATEAQAGVDATAGSLDLWLWGRGSADDLTLAGDTRLVDRLREMAAESTQ